MVIDKGGRTAVATLVERTSRSLNLVPLTGRDSLTVPQAIIVAASDLPATVRRSLIWDCGSEMALHADVTATGLPMFFAHPHSSWERGDNEDLNRIVRKYLLKGWRSPTISPNSPRSPQRSTTDPVNSTIGRSSARHLPDSSRQMLPPFESAVLTVVAGELTRQAKNLKVSLSHDKVGTDSLSKSRAMPMTSSWPPDAPSTPRRASSSRTMPLGKRGTRGWERVGLPAPPGGARLRETFR
ncbi:IS30 family transposase [Actinokineospora pegani]|uniref:IS30 family transposase n=1 Tax=Actinokineospora pegani TaxID=2654637 RepID=UPI0038B255E7